MLGLLFLFAVGVGAYVISDDDGGSSGSSTSNPDQTDITGTDDEDAVVSNDFLDVIDDLLDEGGSTAEEIEAFRNAATFASGPLNVSTLGGDDLVFGSSGDDTIDTGDGDDLVLGGDGDDFIDLGDGDDEMSYAGTEIDANDGQLGPLDAGDDEIYGRKGNDIIVDVLGSNKLSGNEGNDDIVSLDAEGGGIVTPDEVFGGWGQDSLRVDEGDTVTSGVGADRIIIDLDFAGTVEEDYQAVTITDFSVGEDVLALTGSLGVFEDIDEDTEMTISNLPDGSGSVIEILGIEVVRLTGVTDLDRDDLIILGDT